MSSRAEPIPKSLVAAVLALTIVVLGLGGAIIAVKLRPAAVPTVAVDRNIELWERAVIADPNDDSARVGLGMALLDAGRAGDARGVFEDALDINEKNWVALMQLGLLTTAEDPDGAIDMLDRAAKFAPAANKGLPLVAKGDLLMQMSDAEGASDAYRDASAAMPYLFDAHFGLGQALEELGDRKGAIKAYREAARFDPTNQAVADALARLGAND